MQYFHGKMAELNLNRSGEPRSEVRSMVRLDLEDM